MTEHTIYLLYETQEQVQLAHDIFMEDTHQKDFGELYMMQLEININTYILLLL
jgi:hypothetical protein